MARRIERTSVPSRRQTTRSQWAPSPLDRGSTLKPRRGRSIVTSLRRHPAMNNLKRELAPISAAAWKEIDAEATRVLKLKLDKPSRRR